MTIISSYIKVKQRPQNATDGGATITTLVSSESQTGTAQVSFSEAVESITLAIAEGSGFATSESQVSVSAAESAGAATIAAIEASTGVSIAEALVESNISSEASAVKLLVKPSPFEL